MSLEIEEGTFVLLAGPSGSGKSTVLRAFAGLVPDFHGGVFGGRVLLDGRDLRDVGRRELAQSVGIVFQDPEKQLVMTTVERELCFGLENIGLPSTVIARRVAEGAEFLGLTPYLRTPTAELSGGLKQKTVLAAVLVMQPRVLLLDEPTSQLDPAAADEFLSLVRRLNQEYGLTVILSEQRLDRCYHLADRVAVMEAGRVVIDAPPREAAKLALNAGLPYVPAVTRLLAAVNGRHPLTVAEGRRELLRTVAGGHAGQAQGARTDPADLAVEASRVRYAYPRGAAAVTDLSLAVPAGAITTVVGPNGAGKSTLLKLLAGLLKPDGGRIRIFGRDRRTLNKTGLAAGVAYLAQNPNDYLFRDTVAEELGFTLRALGRSGPVADVLAACGLSDLAGVNPRDLSAGERQRVALASLLVAGPSLILLDEPTRGVDQPAKDTLGRLLDRLCRQEGKSVLLVTHDVDFAAEWAAKVVFMAGGRVLAAGTPAEVLGDSLFYSPQVARLFRGVAEVTTFSAARAWMAQAGAGHG